MRALVLGGGGIAGIAWETGILYGLGESVLDADIIVGTSAGSAVAAAVGQIPLAEAFERQIAPDPEPTGGGRRPGPSIDKLMKIFGVLQALPPEQARRKLGEIALTAETMPEEIWVQAIGSVLPSAEWPSRNIGAVAVDAESGETHVFTRESGVDLVLAVAASCAVPGVYPPVTIDGRRYMDGGARTTTNADLVAEYDEIIVIAPIPDALQLPNALVITPDADSLAAMTMNVLDPATRIPSAHAGLSQGKATKI
ncbi:NTE family protein [Kibdelosporangium banguiense]|uniref:NTE family protein n=1 Tax=Kibdelosporangium banguiense TaxID=1365924 RepID=A0ABS4T9X3_9PSEU|nr:patatin-like phospholipase family protein [Kibdelosporangium banguiense]MBP2321208.1 NTE family protein [Kibdelosporangium banguiense]